MAEGAAKRKRGSGRRARPGGDEGRGAAVGFSLSWQLWALVLIGLTVLILAVSRGIFETFGIGLFLIVPWIGVLAWVFRKRGPRVLLRRWNLWLGAFVLTLALLGFLSLFRPHISIAGASLHDKTLAGVFGHALSGGAFGWVRLLGIILVGMVLVFPQGAMRSARRLYRWGKEEAIPRIMPTLRGFGGWVGDFCRGVIRRVRGRRVKVTVNHIERAEGEGTQRAARTKKGPAPDEVQPEEALAPVEEVALPEAERVLPLLELLRTGGKDHTVPADNEERARLIEEALASYGVEVKVREINPGPSVTQFGVEPGWVRKYKKVIEKDASGRPLLDRDGNPKFRMEEVSKTRVKVDRIAALANDLALALAVSDIRIEAPVPGKALVGIEVPNVSTNIVSLRSVLESPVFQKAAAKSRLTVALGQGAGGEAVIGDLGKMPHVLIAGATGSGKTVCLNCFVCCLLFQATPQEVRFVLIDPKRVEMVAYNDIPHLLTPVVVDMDRAVETLRRVTQEMDNRYRKFAAVGARNIESYNRSPKVAERMPYIVVIIDELADLMMTTPDVVEPLLCRLAQLARATGIHLVVATQRPSVDVITGLIKANFPTRISFAVVSSVDSRTILDTIGAEKLLGKGDMLYIPPEASKPKRIRGCYVSDEEIDRVVKFWKSWAAKNFPPASDRVAQEFAELAVAAVDEDPLLPKARQIAEESEHVSASLLQRRLHIGYQRALKLMDLLREEGLLDEDESREPQEGEP